MKPQLADLVFVELLAPATPGYSVARMGTRAYVEDARFDLLGMALAVGDEAVRFYWPAANREQDELGAGFVLLGELAERGTTLVAHDAHFEAMVLQQHFGKRFGATLDTGAYARFLGLGPTLSGVAGWMGLEQGIAPPLDLRSLRDPIRRRSVAKYAMREVALCRALARHALDNPLFPDDELAAVSHTANANLRGVKIGARQVAQLLSDLQSRRDSELSAFTRQHRFDTSSINKDARVQAFLVERFDLFLPTLSRKSAAFAKTVAAGGPAADFLLRRARIQTLSKAIRKATAYSRIDGGRAYGGLHYAGAHTGRFSSGGPDSEKVNLHGLAKANVELDMPELALERRVLVPDEGRMFCNADLAAIEARVVAWLAGEEQLLEQLRRPPTVDAPDLYCWFAGLVFPGVQIHKGGPNAHLRALGKEAVLGLGFGMGLARFTLAVRSKHLACTDADVERAYRTYQDRFPKVRSLRGELTAAFNRARSGDSTEAPLWSMRSIEDDEGATSPTVVVELPTGRGLYYRSVRAVPELTERGSETALWFAPHFGSKGRAPSAGAAAKKRVFADGEVRHRMTPQVMVENVVQAIARDIMIHQVLELEGLGHPVVWHTHDEVTISCPGCTCAPGECSATCSWSLAGRELVRVMGRVPATLPRLVDLPLECELNANVKETYA